MSNETCTGPHSSAFDCPIHDPRKVDNKETPVTVAYADGFRAGYRQGMEDLRASLEAALGRASVTERVGE